MHKKSRKRKKKKIVEEVIVKDEKRENEEVQETQAVVEEEEQVTNEKQQQNKECKKKEALCLLKGLNYTFAYSKQRGVIGKCDFYKTVQLSPRVDELEEVIIEEGTRVQLYPHNDWWVVVLIHKAIRNASRCMLHVRKVGDLNQELDIIQTDSVMRFKFPKHYDTATSADKFAILFARHEIKVSSHTSSPTHTKTNPHANEIGWRKVDKDLLVGVSVKVDALVAEQASLKEEVHKLREDIHRLAEKIQNESFSMVLQAAKAGQDVMVKQAEALGQHTKQTQQQ